MIMLCIFFSGVCINFRQFHYFSKCKLAPHYFSKCKLAPHYFSKCKLAPPYFSKSNSAHHYFSKSNSAHHYLGFSKCKQALIFILNVSQRFSQILCWVSTYIFSLIVSQRAIYLFWYSYYFNSQVWSAYLLICRVRFMMILCVSIVILILYKTFRFWPHV